MILCSCPLDRSEMLTLLLDNYFLKGLLGPYTCLFFFFFLGSKNYFLHNLFKCNHDLIHHSCPNTATWKLMRILPVKETSIYH